MRRSRSGPQQGLPANPRAWLVSAGRFRSIDQLRRQARFDSFDPLAHDAAPQKTRPPRTSTVPALPMIVCG